MKAFNVTVFVLCLLFALLQYNDPDPYIWMPVYLYTAALAWLAYRGKYYKKAIVAGMIFYTLFACYLFLVPDGVIDWYAVHGSENLVQSMKATKPWIEYTREFGGLLFLLVVLSVNLAFNPRSTQGDVAR